MVHWFYLAGLWWCIFVKQFTRGTDTYTPAVCRPAVYLLHKCSVYVVGLIMETLTDCVYKIAMASHGNCNYTLEIQCTKTASTQPKIGRKQVNLEMYHTYKYILIVLIRSTLMQYNHGVLCLCLYVCHM